MGQYIIKANIWLPQSLSQDSLDEIIQLLEAKNKGISVDNDDTGYTLGENSEIRKSGRQFKGLPQLYKVFYKAKYKPLVTKISNKYIGRKNYFATDDTLSDFESTCNEIISRYPDELFLVDIYENTNSTGDEFYTIKLYEEGKWIFEEVHDLTESEEDEAW